LRLHTFGVSDRNRAVKGIAKPISQDIFTTKVHSLGLRPSGFDPTSKGSRLESDEMPGRKTSLLLPVLIIFLSIQGCAGMKIPHPGMATISGVSGHFRIGQIVDLNSGVTLSFEQLIDQIASKDLIFIGETHDNPEHHLIHVQILQALMDRCGPVTIAMESFQKTKQESLDRYLQGELTEDEFIREVNWRGGWGYDYHFYRPLILFARQSVSRVLAINAPRDIVKKVARHGLKSLNAIERDKLAKKIDLNDKEHYAYLRKVYEQHDHGELKKFDYFYEAQCVWEDTMAHNLAEYLREDRKKLIAFTGNGHIINKFGIPDRTIRRFPVSMVTIMPYPLKDHVDIKKEIADYVWLTAHYSYKRKMLHE